MNSNERVIRAIRFQDPDRPPILHAILPSAQYFYGGRLSEIINSFHEDFGWHLLPDLPRDKLPPLYKLGKNLDDMTGKSKDYYARGGWIVFFEQMQQLIGFENLMVALATEIPEVFRLRDDLLKFNLAWLDKWMSLDYQGIHFADDWGSQTNLLIPPELWRSFFKPAYKAMYEAFMEFKW